jgi:thioesterase domain-containing protein/acyl carrier protein
MGEAPPPPDHRQSLLQQYLRKELSRDATPEVIPKRPAEAPVQLSFGQEQLWFLTQLAPETPVCNEALTIRRTGPLDVQALERSLSEIFRRHEVWRTSCLTSDGQPLQKIESPPTWRLPVVDLSDLPEEEREAEALRLATEEARRPFAFDGEPLLRTTLARLGAEDHRLFVTLHQFVIDCTSIYQVLLPELTALYEAFSNDRPSPLQDLPIQYADYSYWQRHQIKNDGLVPQLAYWQERLSGAPDLQLSSDQPPPARRSFRGAMLPFRLPESLSSALRSLSYEERVTPFMTLLASFKALLHLYTPQDDVTVGTATAGRKRPELDPLMGYFLNYLVLRTDMTGDPSFRELLGRVREVTLGALSHDDIPFDRLVRELHPERHPSRNPLFQVAFTHAPGLSMAYSSASSTNTIAPSWTLTQLDVDVGTSKFDLSVDIDDGPEFVAGRLFYSTDLFAATTIDQMIGHWEMLIAGLVADPNRRLSDLPQLTQAVARPAVPPPTNNVPDRRVSPEPTEPRSRNEASGIAPRDELEHLLTTIWERALGVQPISIRENFFHLGGDSLLAIRVFYQIEKALGKHLPLATLFEAPTIEELASVLRQEHWSPRWSALVEIQASGSKPPFFCVHGHGGHVLLFRNLARELGPDQPFYGIQAVGLDGREPPYTRFEDMARHYIEEMRSVQQNGPYFIGGYCLGGPVAYEMARQLHAQGEKVALLVMLDAFRPGYPKLKRFMPPPVYHAVHRLRILAFHFTTTLRLGGGKGTAYLVEGAQRGLADKVGKLLGRLRPLALTQAALMEAYRAYDAPPYAGKIVLFRATSLPLGIQDAPGMGWAGLAEAGIEIEEMPLYYTTEVAGNNVEMLGEKLKARINDRIEQLSQDLRVASAAV